ncbi:MAG: hypothetical protein LBS93_08345, partial [Synergistaceae bacterium]|nr:hypothetical protein [Synergistaceae bacterium]
IVGYNLGTVTDCAAGGTVTVYSNANDYNKSSVAGGIAGYNSYVGIVTNCAASVSVTAYSPWAASSYAGGIVGVNYGATAPHRGMVTNCVASGSVMASASAASYFYAGGVIGKNNANTTVTGNTYGKAATGQEYGIGYDERLNSPGPSDDGAAPR